MRFPNKRSYRVGFLLFLVGLGFLSVSRMVCAQQERFSRSHGRGMDGEMLAAVPTVGSEVETAPVEAGATSFSDVTNKPTASSLLQGFPVGHIVQDFFKNLSKKPEPSISSINSSVLSSAPPIQPALTPQEIAIRLESKVHTMKEETQQQVIALEKAEEQTDSFKGENGRQAQEIRQLALLLRKQQERARRAGTESLSEIEKSSSSISERGIQLTLAIGTSGRKIAMVAQELAKIQLQIRQKEEEIQKGLSLDAVSRVRAKPEARLIRSVQKDWVDLQKKVKRVRTKQNDVQGKLSERKSDQAAVENRLGGLIRQIREQSNSLKGARAGIVQVQGAVTPSTGDTISVRRKTAETIDALLQKEVVQLKQQVQAKQEGLERFRSVASQSSEKSERQFSELKTERDQLAQSLAQSRRSQEEAQHALAEAEQKKADVQEELQQMLTTQASAQQEKSQLKRLFDSREDDRTRLQSELEETRKESVQWKTDQERTRQELDNLQERLKITQGTQEEQAKQLQALRLEASHLNQRNSDLTAALAQISTIQTQVRQLQTERLSLENQVGSLQTVMERAERTYQDRKREISLQSGENPSDMQRLHNEIETAKTEQIQAGQKRGAIQQELKEVGERANKLKADLQDLEQITNEGEASGSAVPSAQIRQPKTQEPPISDAVDQTPREFLSSKVLQVTVQRVSEHLDFFVLSLEGAPGIKEGSVLQLSKEDQPVAEVEVGLIDQNGFAVAYVTHPLEDLSDIREGTLLSARRIVKTPSPTGQEGS